MSARKWLHWGPLAGFLALAWVMGGGLRHGPEALSSPLVGRAAPGFALAALAIDGPAPVPPGPMAGATPASPAERGTRGAAADRAVGVAAGGGAGVGADARASASAGAGAGAGVRADTDARARAVAPVASSPRAWTPEALRGRPWLLNVFASWCAPCRAERPVLAAAARAGVRIVGLDYKDDPATARAWLRGAGNPYVAVLPDPEGRVGVDYGVYGVPETYVVDRDGIVRLRLVGALTEGALRKQVLPLMGDAQ